MNNIKRLKSALKDYATNQIKIVLEDLKGKDVRDEIVSKLNNKIVQVPKENMTEFLQKLEDNGYLWPDFEKPTGWNPYNKLYYPSIISIGIRGSKLYLETRKEPDNYSEFSFEECMKVLNNG